MTTLADGTYFIINSGTNQVIMPETGKPQEGTKVVTMPQMHRKGLTEAPLSGPDESKINITRRSNELYLLEALSVTGLAIAHGKNPGTMLHDAAAVWQAESSDTWSIEPVPGVANLYTLRYPSTDYFAGTSKKSDQIHLEAGTQPGDESPTNGNFPLCVRPTTDNTSPFARWWIIKADGGWGRIGIS